MVTLDDLEALARAATPGPWAAFHDEDNTWQLVETRTPGAANLTDDSGVLVSQDAAYIAACSPERVLALVAVVRAARKEERSHSIVRRADTLTDLAVALDALDALP